MPIRIGIMGEFNPEFPSHVTIGTSLQQHAGRALGVEVESHWLATPSLLGAEGERLMAGYDGLWAAPASPYQSMEGMLNGIEFAGVPSKPGFGLLGWSRGGATGRLSALEAASNMLWRFQGARLIAASQRAFKKCHPEGARPRAPARGSATEGPVF